MKLNNQYLIALDLDGTLLNNNKEISPTTKEYLINLKKNNHKIIFASGRPIRALMNYYNELELDTPLICYNGAKVFNPKNDRFIKENNFFDKEMIKKIINDISYKIIESVMCETDDEIWVDKKDEFLFLFFLKDGMNIKCGEINKILDKNPITFIAKYIDTPSNREIIKKEITKYDDIDVRFWDNDSYFEIFYKHINKYNSIKRIAQYYNIPESNIYAFGDADNDIEVITHCPNGVAMLNSSPMLKKLAKKTTKFDNNNDGIIRWLEDNLFSKN